MFWGRLACFSVQSPFSIEVKQSTLSPVTNSVTPRGPKWTPCSRTPINHNTQIFSPPYLRARSWSSPFNISLQYMKTLPDIHYAEDHDIHCIKSKVLYLHSTCGNKNSHHLLWSCLKSLAQLFQTFINMKEKTDKITHQCLWSKLQIRKFNIPWNTITTKLHTCKHKSSNTHGIKLDQISLKLVHLQKQSWMNHSFTCFFLYNTDMSPER